MKTIKTWCFNLLTGEYTGIYNAPKDSKSRGRYQIPAFATTIEPPEPNENQKVIWDGIAWQLEDIPQPEPEAESTINELGQQEIALLEGELHGRYYAYLKLSATGATPGELDECKAEIQIILESLEVLYNAEPAETLSNLRTKND